MNAGHRARSASAAHAPRPVTSRSRSKSQPWIGASPTTSWPGAGAEGLLGHGADEGGWVTSGSIPPRALVLVEHEVRLDEHAGALRGSTRPGAPRPSSSPPRRAAGRLEVLASRVAPAGAHQRDDARISHRRRPRARPARLRRRAPRRDSRLGGACWLACAGCASTTARWSRNPGGPLRGCCGCLRGVAASNPGAGHNGRVDAKDAGLVDWLTPGPGGPSSGAGTRSTCTRPPPARQMPVVARARWTSLSARVSVAGAASDRELADDLRPGSQIGITSAWSLVTRMGVLGLRRSGLDERVLPSRPRRWSLVGAELKRHRADVAAPVALMDGLAEAAGSR